MLFEYFLVSLCKLTLVLACPYILSKHCQVISWSLCRFPGFSRLSTNCTTAVASIRTIVAIRHNNPIPAKIYIDSHESKPAISKFRIFITFS